MIMAVSSGRPCSSCSSRRCCSCFFPSSSLALFLLLLVTVLVPPAAPFSSTAAGLGSALLDVDDESSSTLGISTSSKCPEFLDLGPCMGNTANSQCCTVIKLAMKKDVEFSCICYWLNQMDSCDVARTCTGITRACDCIIKKGAAEASLQDAPADHAGLLAS